MITAEFINNLATFYESHCFERITPENEATVNVVVEELKGSLQLVYEKQSFRDLMDRQIEYAFAASGIPQPLAQMVYNRLVDPLRDAMFNIFNLAIKTTVDYNETHSLDAWFNKQENGNE